MKKYFAQLLGICAVATVLVTACKKDEVQATVQPSAAPTLTSSATAVTLSQANSTQPAVTFTWTGVTENVTGTSNSISPAVTYQLQFAKAGTNFAKPVAISAGAGPKTTITVADLNDALQSAGLVSGTAGAVEVRLNAYYAANYNVASASVPLTATTYTFCGVPAKSWDLIGPAGKGWSTDIVMGYDCAAKAFTYTGPLNADEFKFRYNSDWTAKLGGPSSTGGALTQDGPNLKIATAGTYTIVLVAGTIDASGKVSGGTFTIK